MIEYLQGDCREVLKTLPEKSIHCCVTSPPYWGLRDYGVDGQLGMENTPEEYVQNMVQVFCEVKRVMRDDGTLWLNLGDSYCGTGNKGSHVDPKNPECRNAQMLALNNKVDGLKSKDLVGIPWRVAFALQSDGWYLRSDIIWHKPNPMPESVTDRCTKSHEYIFLLSKNAKYYYDCDAIKEQSTTSENRPHGVVRDREYGYDSKQSKLKNAKKLAAKQRDVSVCSGGIEHSTLGISAEIARNKRSVWTVPTSPYSGAHFAVFPPDLIRPCIMAGCPDGGTVLDPFGGSGTTALVAEQEGKNAILIELNEKYVELSKGRTSQTSLLSQ
jgi:DNA modification methylase